MNGMRKLVGIVMALAFAAFALPAFAASGNNKIYTLDMLPSSLTSNATASMTADFGNISPDGNSSYKSLKLFAPAGITITGVTVQSAGFTATTSIRNAAGAIVAEGTAVWVDSINLPVKPFGPHFVLQLAVKTGCSGGGDWTTIAAAKDQVWSGTGWSGQNFLYSGGNRTTAPFAGLCSMSISGPTSAVVGTATTNNFTMTVNLNGGPGGDVTLASTCGFTGVIPPDNTKTTSGNSATFTGYVANPGTCTFTATAANPAYSPASPYTITVYKGTIACGSYADYLGNVDSGYPLDPDANVEYVIPGGSGWGLRRGPNKDGSDCSIKVNYTCNLDASTALASCSWDKTTSQGLLATFKYVFVWPAVSPEANGWKDFHPLVSWGIANPGDPALYNWVPGLACISDIYPAAVAGSPATYPDTIFPITPDAAPYSDKDSSNNFKAPAQYRPGVKAGVCIGQQGSTSVGAPSGPVQLQFWHKVLDYADVLVKGPTS